MFEKKDNRRRNFLTVVRLIAVAAFILLIISRYRFGPEREVLRTVGITLLIGFVIARVWFSMKPGAFRDRSANPDEEGGKIK
jgi:hypothetical protein